LQKTGAAEADPDMVQGYHLDPDERAKVADEHFAIVYAPKRSRDRVPESNVRIVESEAVALAGADPDRKLYPARVVGPARSSEGLRVFYIVRWLDQAPDAPA
jgi:hypothetical protein